MASDVGEIRILTVDDHALLRKGIAALIGAEPDMKLVAEASNGQEAIAQFKTHRPHVTLMDLQMPGMSGIECIIAIRSDFPNVRIIVLTTHPDDVQVLRALSASGGEYKRLTVLFADIRNSTSLIDSLGDAAIAADSRYA